MMTHFEHPGGLSAELLVRAYASGVFPMAESRDSPQIHWIDPRQRGILPLDAMHVPKRLARTYRQRPFQITADRCFERVIAACAAPAPGRDDSWINAEIEAAYTELHHRGAAHSIECWQESQLVGGLYGVSLGAAFFGESMFSHATDASKIALIALMIRLRAGGYRLFDVQFRTEHLSQFGVVDIAGRDYLELLGEALSAGAAFVPELSDEDELSGLGALRQSSTQTS